MSYVHCCCEQPRSCCIQSVLGYYADIHPDHVCTQPKKGSAAHVSCDATTPPPLDSTANRVDWSNGKGMDVYCQFAKEGDADY